MTSHHGETLGVTSHHGETLGVTSHHSDGVRLLDLLGRHQTQVGDVGHDVDDGDDGDGDVDGARHVTCRVDHLLSDEVQEVPASQVAQTSLVHKMKFPHINRHNSTNS